VSTSLERALAQLESDQAERTYELWRKWAKEHADQQGEEPKRRHGNTSGSEDRGGQLVSRALLPVDSRTRWVAWALACIVGALLWLAIAALIRWIFGL
jgi:hypothetical protein